MNKTIYNKVLLISILALTLTACVKDDLYDCSVCEQPTQPTEPEQPSDEGVVEVEIDLSNMPDSISIDDFIVEIDGTPLGDNDGNHFLSDTLSTGEYDVLIYNIPEGFTITDGIAYVNTVDGESGLILSQPGHLYSGTGHIIVEGNDTTQVNVSVDQRTRDLSIELTVTEGDPDRIVSVTGTLSGLAGAYDLQNETLYGDPVSTNLVFTVDGDQVTVDLRLLGIMGDTQTLTLHIVFSNGDTLDVEYDLSELLATFNDGDDPFTLTGNLHLSVEAGFEGNIIEWQQTDGGNIDAH